MSRIDEKRASQRERLIDAAEATIAAKGLSALKARDLASAAGVSLGGLYNLVGDLDEVILRVGARTLARLDASLAAAAKPDAGPVENLVAIAIAYSRFARENRALWRALFEHRMAPEAALPDWHAAMQLKLFGHVAGPLRALLPLQDEEERVLLSRTLFSAVHGVVALGLDEKIVAVPASALEDQISRLTRATATGLVAQIAV